MRINPITRKVASSISTIRLAISLICAGKEKSGAPSNIIIKPTAVKKMPIGQKSQALKTFEKLNRDRLNTRQLALGSKHMREHTTPQEPLELSLIYPVESTQISLIEMVLILSKANSEVYNLMNRKNLYFEPLFLFALWQSGRSGWY